MQEEQLIDSLSSNGRTSLADELGELRNELDEFEDDQTYHMKPSFSDELIEEDA